MAPEPVPAAASAPTPAPPASPSNAPDPYNYGNPKRNFNFIEFNPPINRFTSGAYVDRTRKNQTSTNSQIGRNEILGPDRFDTRLLDKGVIYQDTDSKIPEADGTTSWGLKNPTYKNFNTMGQHRYGFKFHYNPSTIDFSVRTDNNTIDPALYLSGMTRAVPIATASLPVVTFSVILNRIEDVSALQTGGWGAKDMLYYYGRKLTDEEKFGIVTRGTGYDMEYLFRTMLGRPYVTDLRGTTADIGVAFGLPLILDFSPKSLVDITKIDGKRVPTTSTFGSSPAQHGLRYWGRITGISYTHREFSREMVPMFTELTIEFARFPDAKGKLNEEEPTPGASTPNTNANNPPKNAGALDVVNEAMNDYYVPTVTNAGALSILDDGGPVGQPSLPSPGSPSPRYRGGWEDE